MTIIDRSPPGGLLFQKEHSRAGAGGVFTHPPRAKKKAQGSIYRKGVAAKWPPGMPGGTLGGALGVLWGALGVP